PWTARCWRTSPCTTRPGLPRWRRRRRALWRHKLRTAPGPSAGLAPVTACMHGEGRKSFPICFSEGPFSMSDIQTLAAQALADIAAAQTPEALEALRVGLLGKQGAITAQLKQLGALPPEQRKAAGEAINRVRDEVSTALSARRALLEEATLDARLAGEAVDVTLPGRLAQRGGIHPIS